MFNRVIPPDSWCIVTDVIARFWRIHELIMEHFHCFAAFFAQSLAGLFAWHHSVKIITAHVAMLESQLLHNCHLCRKNTNNSYCIYSLVNRSIAQFVFFSVNTHLFGYKRITTLWNDFHPHSQWEFPIDLKCPQMNLDFLIRDFEWKPSLLYQ